MTDFGLKYLPGDEQIRNPYPFGERFQGLKALDTTLRPIPEGGSIKKPLTRWEKFKAVRSSRIKDSVMEPGFFDSIMEPFNTDNASSIAGGIVGGLGVEQLVQFANNMDKGMRGEINRDNWTIGQQLNFIGTALEYATGGYLMKPKGSFDPNDLYSFPAFHGSPHRIKGGKFLDKAIGSGEGAQAFGYGHYFTDTKSIAEGYAKELSGKKRKFYLNGKKFTPKSPDTVEAIRNAFIFSDGSKKDIIAFIKSAKKDAVTPKLIDEDLKNIGMGKISIDGENLYKTTLHKGKDPSEYNYLRWDDSINKDQLKKIKDSTDDPIMKMFGNPANNNKGEEVYKQISRQLGGDKEASKFLKEAGIDGIKYPAGTLSGGNKTNAFNYVVFDPKDITIDEHYVNGVLQ